MKDKSKSIFENNFNAQYLCFAPILFQAAKSMRDLGILELIESSSDVGITASDIAEKLNISVYGVSVLLDLANGTDLVLLKDDKYTITETGKLLINDELTKINMDFVNDVCYNGMFYLEEAIRKEKPAGLKTFGKWDTIYHALSSLPKKVQESWFKFDQYYSDNAFKKALPIVFKQSPRKILDVGGNTGKWAMECVKYSNDVKVTILDLAGQIEKAKHNIGSNGFSKRISLYPIDLLDHSKPFPKEHDTIWMSQFLDCFSKEHILNLLKRAYDAMDENANLFIMETYIDRQRFDAAKLCLQNTSLYFTCMANGNSRMYYSNDIAELVNEAGLYIVDDIDNVGITHTIFKCKKR